MAFIVHGSAWCYKIWFKKLSQLIDSLLQADAAADGIDFEFLGLLERNFAFCMTSAGSWYYQNDILEQLGYVHQEDLC